MNRWCAGQGEVRVGACACYMPVCRANECVCTCVCRELLHMRVGACPSVCVRMRAVCLHVSKHACC